MRGKSPWILTSILVLGLLLVCVSHRQCIAISLPVAMLIGLGIPAALLFWEHRQKLSKKLGTQTR
ncbi:MAG: hypothetical protein A2Y73_05475 [Chloroflexi bacterium RBG_13_56_8]|nr:MAG: hypothetical protein A2Y73_05475 [Chloroflexi bacterium RBG_13_56_8]